VRRSKRCGIRIDVLLLFLQSERSSVIELDSERTRQNVAKPSRGPATLKYQIGVLEILYFGGVLICAEMAQKTYAEKLAVAKRLMAMTPIERVVDICGSTADRALRDYDYFLGEMAKAEVREHLSTIPEYRDQHTERFRVLKNRGQQFTSFLMSALAATYPPSHPIHRALVM
jgi:hypothetical protein